MTAAVDGTATARGGWISAGEPEVDDVVASLLDTCRRERTTTLDLGLLDVVRHDPVPLLEALAERRQEHVYGLRLSCRLRIGTPADCPPDLLRAAGVHVVELLRPAGPPGEHLEDALLRFVEMVARLHEQGITVVWDVPVASFPPADVLGAAPLLSYFHHLPPPAVPRVVADAPDAVRVLNAAVGEWQRLHVPSTLTYGRGPGFVRVFDRRAAGEVVTFVTLDGAQADVFLAATTASTTDALARAAGGAAVARVERFLDLLVARRLMCRSASGLYQSLPTRRRLEERWVEGDG